MGLCVLTGISLVFLRIGKCVQAVCHPSNSESVPRPRPKAGRLCFLNRKCVPGQPGISRVTVSGWTEKQRRCASPHIIGSQENQAPFPLLSYSRLWCLVMFVLPSFILAQDSRVTFQNRTTELQQTGLHGLGVRVFSVNQSSNSHSTIS